VTSYGACSSIDIAVRASDDQVSFLFKRCALTSFFHDPEVIMTVTELVESEQNACDRDAIRKLIEIEWSAAIVARDWERLLGLCTEDIVYCPPDHAVLFGRTAFRKWLNDLPPIKKFSQTLVEIEGRGPLAVARATFSITFEISGQTITATGNALGWLRQHGLGRWLTKSVCFNYDHPVSA
jgi:ketosteroid isomerase-like protein